MHRYILPLILLSSCTWISDSDLEDARSNADDDGDGFAKKDDCNDVDSSIFPGAEDSWYDGIDSNCEGDDDYDADGDGYVPSEYAKLTTKNVPGSGNLAVGDCWDDPNSPTPPVGAEDFGVTSQDIHPSQDPDADPPYDGIDQNCDNQHDFDADRDGYVPDIYEGIPTINISSTNSLPAGDCDDNNNLINPNAVDTWYDGIDHDCQENDDYDADGDGYQNDEDCDDTPTDADEDGVPDGFAINPGQAETWYDGIDADCLEDDDYDADGDGYQSADYAEVEGVEGSDCNDQDPEANPDATEILSDSRDLDCDNGAQSIKIHQIEWTTFDVLNGAPESAKYLAADANETDLYIAFIEDTTVSGDGGASPLAIGFDLTTRTPTDFFNWATISYGFTPGLAITVTNTDFFGVFGENNLQDRWLHLTARNLNSGTITHRRSFVGSLKPDFEDVDIFMDADDNIHAVGCESSGNDDGLQYVMNPSSSFFSTTGLLVKENLSGISLSRCKIYAENQPSAELLGVNSGTLEDYSFDLPDKIDQIPPAFTLSANQPLSPTDISELILLDQESGKPLLYTTGQSIVLKTESSEFTLVDNVVSSSVHAEMFSEDLITVGFVTTDEQAYFIVGDPASLVLDLAAATNNSVLYQVGGDFEVTEIYPWITPDGDHIIVTILGSDSNNDPMLGWGQAQIGN